MSDGVTYPEEDAQHWKQERDEFKLLLSREQDENERLRRDMRQAHEEITRLGVLLADRHHQWTLEERRAWERADRYLSRKD